MMQTTAAVEQQNDTTQSAKKHKHFTQFPNWIIDSSNLKRGALAAYNRFWRIYAHTGCQFVGSYYDLSDELGVAKTTLERYVPQWVDEGIIYKGTIIVDGKRGRKKQSMELTIPLDDIWKRNDGSGQITHIRPKNDGKMGQNGNQSSPKRAKTATILAQKERQSSPKRDEGGPKWATNAPKWANVEGKNGGNTGNTTTNVVSNTLNTQDKAAIAACVNQGLYFFLGSLTDIEETLAEAFLDEVEEPLKENLEEKIGDSPTEFPIANSTIEPSFDQAEQEVNDYTKGSVFPESWTNQECITWFEQHQGYPFRTNQHKKAGDIAEELRASYSPRQAILTFLFMKYIDPYWVDPRKNGLVNLFLVNKLIQTKNAERQTTSWFVEALPSNCRGYYEEEMSLATSYAPEKEDESNVPAYLRPNTFAPPVVEEEKDGQRAPEPEEREGEPEEGDETIKRAGDRCGYLACNCAPGQIDNCNLLWCEEHSVRGSFMNSGLLYDFPEIVYNNGKVRQGRQGWQEWVRVVTTDNFWQAVGALPHATKKEES